MSLTFEERERARNELYHYGVKDMKWDKTKKKLGNAVREAGKSWKNAPKDIFNEIEKNRKAGQKANQQKIKNEKKAAKKQKKTFNNIKKNFKNTANNKDLKKKVRKAKIKNAVDKVKSKFKK